MPKAKAYKYWKVNARGVDINRNFPGNWARKRTAKQPASEGYAGKTAKREAETKALLKLINRLPNLKACVLYHSMGEVVYWGAQGSGKHCENAYKLAKLARKTTGYRTVESSKLKPTSPGGNLERYLLSKKRIPYVCIETGKQKCPLKHSLFHSIYKKNKTMIEKTADLYD